MGRAAAGNLKEDLPHWRLSEFRAGYAKYLCRAPSRWSAAFNEELPIS